MSDIITVIAYKENTVDTCRGCVMGHYDSAIDMFSSTNPEAIMDHVADLKARDLEEYGSFDFTFLINGRCVHYDGYHVSEDIPDDLDYEVIAANDEMIGKIISEANARVAAIVAKRKAEKEAADRQQKVREERAREQRERAQLAELQRKYGD